MRPLMDQELLLFTIAMSSLILDFRVESYQTETPALPPYSPVSFAVPWGLHRTSPPLTTLRQMDSRSVPTSGWSNTCASSVTDAAPTGLTGFPPLNLLITPGLAQPPNKPPLTSSWVTLHAHQPGIYLSHQ